MTTYNNRMFIDRSNGLHQEDRDAILGILLREGPYLVEDGKDEYLIFSDPRFLTQDVCELSSYEASKMLSFFDQQMWSAWKQDIEKEAAVAVTVMNLRNLTFEDDEIAEFFCLEPEPFDVSGVLVSKVMHGLGDSQHFNMPTHLELFAD